MTDEWGAYQVDYAVLVLGKWVESELHAGKKIEDLLSQKPKGYKPLADKVTQKVSSFPWET